MKKAFCVIIVILLVLPHVLTARIREENPRKMGSLMEASDSTRPYSNRLEQRLFISKGEFGVGAQFSYIDLASSDSQFLMILQNLNAYAKTFSVTPSVSYAIADNKSIGLQMKYSTSDALVSTANLGLLSEDLSLDIKDLEAHDNTVQVSVFYRSYAGLDTQGRFGLFSDIQLAYARANTSFSYNGVGIDSSTVSDKVKLSLHPGLELFVTNNISVHLSIGIGGVSYTGLRCINAGEVTGRRDASNARFYLDITDIAFGITVHI